jgi:hypothetical protein
MSDFPDRAADGWEPRFIAEGRRVEEAVALYESLGFEVAADPPPARDLPPGCGDCQVVVALQFRMIYTRKRKGPSA